MSDARDENRRTAFGAQIGAAVRRVRRALFYSGNIALMLGALVGLLQVYPELLAARLKFPVSEWVIAVGGLALLGLTAGAVAGLTLRGVNGVMRFSVGMFVTIVGLIVSEIVRGIALRLSLREALTGVSSGLVAAQIGLAALGVLIGVQTGHTKYVQLVTASPSPRRLSTRTARRQRTRTPRQPATVAAAAESASEHSFQIVSPAPQARPLFKKRRLVRRVHLGRQKTSVCPYCLEEVKPHDPRGVVRCKICGTPHHADCWAITGKCEVPHLQT